MRSYAQYHEDLRLWRALKDVKNGFYVDVGAGHPEDINVTKMFYDQGWVGINIEPDTNLYMQLFSRRVWDVNLCVAAGSTNGEVRLLYFAGAGISANKPEVRQIFEAHGHTAQEVLLAQRTLDSILAKNPPPGGEIHFLKIDVEGCEAEVLAGFSFRPMPWIVVCEATLPTTEIRSEHLWEGQLLRRGYQRACFDGLNCFYVSPEHADLVEPLRTQEPAVKTAFVYVTHLQDLHWLSYSLQFLRRNWREPGTEIVVRAEPDCMETFKSWGVPGVRYEKIGKWSDGYSYQMYMKLTADEWTDADLILLIDSDVMLIGPAWLDDMMAEGKIIINHLPWSASPDGEKVWRRCSSEALGMDIDKDYMVRHPFAIWRPTFAKVRAQIEKTVGKNLQHYMYSDQVYSPKTFTSHRFPLADYECLNCYALKCEPDRYVGQDVRGLAGWPFRVYWSHGDYSEELRQEFERRLRI